MNVTLPDDNLDTRVTATSNEDENKIDNTHIPHTTDKPTSLIVIPTNDEDCQENPKLKNNCARPKTWLTTVPGETRDFFRILTSTPK